MDDFDFEAPSFSLGIDLDDHHADLVVEDSDPEPTADESSKLNVSRRQLTKAVIQDSDSEPAVDESFRLSVRRRRLTKAVVEDSDSEPATDDYSMLNVRRRRLTTAAAAAAAASAAKSAAADCNGEDEEIEDFSSQDDLSCSLGNNTSVQNQAMCSSSKASLPARGSVIVDKSVRKLQSSYQNDVSRDEINYKGEGNGGKLEIPKLTISPVRKFLLVESDSEDFTDVVKTDTIPKRAKTSGGLTEPSGKKSVKESGGQHQNEDLWNDFLSPKKFTFSTPALDEVCDEYFHTLKEKTDVSYSRHPERMSNYESVSGKLIDLLIQQNPGIQGSIPPAHRYFFHNDMRIQNLVRSRLQNFYPLVDVLDNRGDDLFGSPNIDYRSQFNQGKASTSRKQSNQKSKVAGNSKKSRRKNTHVAENASQASESWVNPRVSAGSSKPRVAGQRRVRADSSSDGGCPIKASSIGHWFTDSDGKRVYVSSNGQELTGRLAYIHYKKESGGFKKSRKKAAAKKK